MGDATLAQLILVLTLIVCVVFLLLFALIFLLIFRQWLRCFMSGAQVSIFDILGSKFRRTPTALLIDAHLALHHQGKPVRFSTVEACYLANPTVVDLHSFLEILPKFIAEQGD